MDRRFHGAFTAATTAAEAMGVRGRHRWLVGGYDPYLPTYSLSLATLQSKLVWSEKFILKPARNAARQDILY